MNQPEFEFRLYIAGAAENSALAMSNLDALCQANLLNRHRIEVVDVLEDPSRAFSDGIYMTPTLLKLMPAPVRKIIGTLSETRIVMRTLGLGTVA